MHRKLACVWMCAHSQGSCVHTLTHETAGYNQKSTHHAHDHTHIHPGCTYTPRSSKAIGPSLPVACTMHSWDVTGCTSGRWELAGRTSAGTGQEIPILWPPLRMWSWCPTHSHLCPGPAETQEPLTKPPWPVIGYIKADTWLLRKDPQALSPLNLACGCHLQNSPPTLYFPSSFTSPYGFKSFVLFFFKMAGGTRPG